MGSSLQAITFTAPAHSLQVLRQGLCGLNSHWRTIASSIKLSKRRVSIPVLKLGNMLSARMLVFLLARAAIARRIRVINARRYTQELAG
ncbi:MAG: hypothetical protein QGH08_07095 [Arenicellales bacterium]|nr:hypothetical protein [Arenicellales bacterium]